MAEQQSLEGQFVKSKIKKIVADKRFLTGITILLVVLPVLFGFWLRALPAGVPAADQWARSTIQNQIRADIDNQIAAQFPNMPAANRQQVVNEEFQKVLAAQEGALDERAGQMAEYFRSRVKDPDGQTYLTAIDSYHHMRLSKNIAEHGYAGDRIVNGRSWDDHMVAPLGRPTASNLHTWLGAMFYKIAQFFKPDVGFMGVFYWIPAIIAPLAAIPAFFLTKRKTGVLAGFIVAMFIVIHRGFLGRTSAGFSDTDAYVVLFPLLIAWFFLEAFETKYGEWKRMGLYLLLTAVSFALFAWVWNWGFFFALIIYQLLAYLIYDFIRHWVRTKKPQQYFKSDTFKWWAALFGGFVVLTGLFVIPVAGLKTYFLQPILPFIQSTTFKAAVEATSIWPNVLTTVAELNAPSIDGIINNIGGKPLFVLALMGLLGTLVGRDKLNWKDGVLLGFGFIVFLILVSPAGTKLSIFWFLVVMGLPVGLGFLLLLHDKRGIDIKYALFLITWLAASVFTMTQGIRFVLLLIPPFAVAAGIAIGIIYQYLKEWLVKGANFSQYWVVPLLFVLFSLLLATPISQGYQDAKQQAPSMNDAWWDSLTQIKEQSEENAIVNSWWDFGHWFKYVADRAVTFDGASQSTPMAHWIGLALLTDSEKEAVAILRMLDCGSSLGVQDVERYLDGDQYRAIMLTKQIIMMPPEDAANTLASRGFSQAEIDTVLNHTHCAPPENFFITSGDMVGKAAVWGHFGGWDFAKADAYKRFRNQPQATAIDAMMQKYNWTQAEATDAFLKMQSFRTQPEVNQWISPWPGYQGAWRQCNQVNETATCTLNIQVGQQPEGIAVAEQLSVNLSDFSQTKVQLGLYDSNGRKLSTSEQLVPGTLFLFDENYSRLQLENATFGSAFVLDINNGTLQRTMIADPANGGSMFTRLFFLEGKGTTAFEEFTDLTSFTGLRIVTWKVNWEKLEELGLV